MNEEIDLRKVKQGAKILSAAERRKRFHKLDFMTFSPVQWNVLNSQARYTAARTGNQFGKTTVACAATAMHATGEYPESYKGWRMPLRQNTGSHAATILIVAPTSNVLRDVQWGRLLGDVTGESTIGTGLIPFDHIVKINMGRGISGLVDNVVVRHASGATVQVLAKSYEMARDAFQGLTVDFLWTDEDPGFGSDMLLSELLARLTATGGHWLHTATPILGKTPFRRFWRDHPNDPQRVEVRGSVFDNPFIPAAELEEIKTRYRQSERATRLMGDDMQGLGQVFEYRQEAIEHTRDPSTFPSYWKAISGFDGSHGGSSDQAHPAAWVAGALDPDTGTVYITEAIRMRQMQPHQHVECICKSPIWDSPCAWGADLRQGAVGTNASIIQLYRDRGLPMLADHAKLSDGSVSLEGSVALVQNMLDTGKLKIARHLRELFDEMADYHRDENLKIVPIDDDLISAMRYLVMSLRYAKALSDDPLRRPISKDQKRIHNQRLREARGREPDQYDGLFD